MVNTCATCGRSFATDHAVQRHCSVPCAMAARTRRPIADRFWAKVAKGDGCWEWTGARNSVSGYGSFGLDRETMVYAHRMAWELTNGPIPEGLFVCHSCDNRPCVRPDHLFLGTHSDNMQDMVAKGRAPKDKPSQRGVLNPQAKLTAAQVRDIRASAEPHTVLAPRYGVTATLIRAIRNRKAWAWLE